MRKAILKPACLKSFVMKVVSLPMYMKVAHFRFVGWSSGCGGGGEEEGWDFAVVSGRICCVGCYGYSLHVGILQ